MPSSVSLDGYSPREIARAAGVPERAVLQALGGRRRLVPHEEAVRIGRALKYGPRANVTPAPLFAIVSRDRYRAGTRIPFALSSALHGGLLAIVIFITTLGVAPATAVATNEDLKPEPVSLIFVATPGPGGGGGGGGLLQKAPPPRARREGRHSGSSPIPLREPPKSIVPAEKPPEPAPRPLEAEPLPAVVAPVITAPADNTNRIGVIENTPAQTESHGPGKEGGVGSGKGTGVGEGEGSGIGPGSG